MSCVSHDARVSEVRLDTAHDSESLVVVVLAYPSGGRGRLQLDGEAVQHLLEALGLHAVDELVGQPFSRIAPALPANRG